MDRSQKALLSPHEEVTLRHVALGSATCESISKRDLQRLRHLMLVVDVRGRIELTPLGRRRYSALPRMAEGPDVARSDAIDQLEHCIRKARHH